MQQYTIEELQSAIIARAKQIGSDDGDGNRVVTLSDGGVVYASVLAIVLRPANSRTTISNLSPTKLLEIAKDIKAI